MQNKNGLKKAVNKQMTNMDFDIPMRW